MSAWLLLHQLVKEPSARWAAHSPSASDPPLQSVILLEVDPVLVLLSGNDTHNVNNIQMAVTTVGTTTFSSKERSSIILPHLFIFVLDLVIEL